MTGLSELTIHLENSGIGGETLKKWRKLTGILSELNSAVIAYSGGVDSTFLAYVSFVIMGKGSLAVFVHTDVESEYQNSLAQRWSAEIGFPLVSLSYNLLNEKAFVENPVDRCYYCKKILLSLVCQYAGENGFSNVLEGQNQDDLGDYRPGRKAVREAGVLSPLAEVGLTKAEIRLLAKTMNLPVWDLPSSPCLASRIPYGLPVTRDGLAMVEKGESFLREMGFTDVRVRIHEDLARIEVDRDQVERLLKESDRITPYFKSIGFLYVTVDLQGYRQGSLHEGLKK